jgi:phosphoribosylglycinamide formyltransferase-1
MTSTRFPIAVLISGGGSNLQALIDACSAPNFPASIALVLSNNPNAKGLERASLAHIPTCIITHHDFATREAFDQAMIEAIAPYQPQLICLAGFMRLLSPIFVNHWHNKLINIHPSLLPSFKGAHAQRDALHYGATITGATIHFVRQAMDHGPIIAQGAVPILGNDDETTLKQRILSMEHQLYPQAVRWIAEGHLTIEGDKITRHSNMNAFYFLS